MLLNVIEREVEFMMCRVMPRLLEDNCSLGLITTLGLRNSLSFPFGVFLSLGIWGPYATRKTEVSFGF